MSDLNMVQLIGRLGQDPEIRNTPAGLTIANLRIATGEKWKDKQSGEWKESTEWHTVVFFGRTAEVAQEYLRKGKQVYIQGSLRTRKWQDKSGNDRYSTEIVGSDLKMLGSKGDSGGGSYGGESRDEAPRGGRHESQGLPLRGGGGGTAPAGGGGADFDDDIPF